MGNLGARPKVKQSYIFGSTVSNFFYFSKLWNMTEHNAQTKVTKCLYVKKKFFNVLNCFIIRL